MEESWLKTYWRPAMAWQYMVVCLFDFVLAPIMMAWLSVATGTPIVPWVSLTLQGSGLYHLAMGAVIGVATWSRGKEKIQKMMVDGGIIESESEITTQTPT